MTSHGGRLDQFAKEMANLRTGDRAASAPVFADRVRPIAGQLMVHDVDGAARVRYLAHAVLNRVFADLQSGHRLDGRPGDGLRETCDAARHHGLHAEELLVILKQGWHHMADTKVIDRHQTEATLNRLVTRCIREYYRTDSPADLGD